jgi:hypothetical protein
MEHGAWGMEHGAWGRGDEFRIHEMSGLEKLNSPII